MLTVPYLLLFISLASAASKLGGVSLWSDSGCGKGDTTNFGEPDRVVLNYTLAIDTCGSPIAAVHSYQLTQVPSCANGTEASFGFFNSDNCQIQGFGPALNSIDPNPSEIVGECLALVEFSSVAFICEGIGRGGRQRASSSTSTLASSSTASTSTIASLSSTSSSSSAFSSTTSTSTLASSSGTLTPGTSPSGGLPSPSGSAIKPSPSSFTGAASEVRLGFRVLVALVAVFML